MTEMDTLHNNELLERYKNARAVEASYLKDRSALATTGLSNARDGAKQLVAAASAVATVYAAALGLVFGVKDNPLPERAIWAVLFFGLAIYLGSVYLAPVRLQAPTLDLAETGGQTLPTLAKLSNNITQIANEMSAHNRAFVRGSIAALGVGVGAMAFPFLTLSPKPLASTAVAPPIPQVALTGAAERAYGYQVTIYERALCKDASTRSVVGDDQCIAVGGDQSSKAQGLARLADGKGTSGTTTTGKGWFGRSDNTVARLYAAMGLGAVVLSFAGGLRRRRQLVDSSQGPVIGPLLVPADRAFIARSNELATQHESEQSTEDVPDTPDERPFP